MQEAVFLKRYKRFFADVQFPSGVETVHVANTGSLKSALEPGSPCLVSMASNPERKLKWSLEAVQSTEGAWIGVNTAWPNKLAEEAFHQRLFPHWKKFDTISREVRLSKETRLDLCLSKKNQQHFVEIKNVTFKIGKGAAFPDAVTERGKKHLQELIRLKTEGHGAELMFVVQRQDCDFFAPADEIDPEYGKLLREAIKAGVKLSAFVTEVSPRDIRLTAKALEVRT